MASPPLFLLSRILSLTLFFASDTLAATTLAPQTRPVSIMSDPAFATARSCAQICLYYNGFHNSELAEVLGCSGLSVANQCFCRSDLTSVATAHLSTCIPDSCGNTPNVDQDLQGEVGLYERYCATVNGVPVTSRPAEETGDLGSQAAGGSRAQATGNAFPRETAATMSDGDSDSGLGKSDAIALGVGLGVGIPSVLLALATLCIQLQKRKHREAVKSMEMQPGMTQAEGRPT